MSGRSNLDNHVERPSVGAEDPGGAGAAGAGISHPRPAPADVTQPLPPAPRAPLTPSDPAAQIVESAHQIVTMIGANPRAIRPILTQRRLTKEQVLAAAAAVSERVAVSLAELDAAVARSQAEPRGQRAFLIGLRDRAAKVVEVYEVL